MTNSIGSNGWLNPARITMTEDFERELYGGTAKELREREEATIEHLMKWLGVETVEEAEAFLAGLET